MKCTKGTGTFAQAVKMKVQEEKRKRKKNSKNQVVNRATCSIFLKLKPTLGSDTVPSHSHETEKMKM